MFKSGAGLSVPCYNGRETRPVTLHPQHPPPPPGVSRVRAQTRVHFQTHRRVIKNIYENEEETTRNKLRGSEYAQRK